MDYFLKRYKEEVGSLLEPLGFKFKKGRFYIRVTKEKVYQLLELSRKWGGLRFVARPLFMGKLLGLLHDGTWIEKRWYNNQKNEDVQNEIIAEMVEIIKNDVIPFFEKTETIQGAYQADALERDMDYHLTLYQAREGDCKPIIEFLEKLIIKSKDVERENLVSERKLGRSEESIQEYIKKSEELRSQAKERIDFFTNSSPEVIAEYFKANEDEALEELKVKWKFKL